MKKLFLLMILLLVVGCESSPPTGQNSTGGTGPHDPGQDQSNDDPSEPTPAASDDEVDASSRGQGQEGAEGEEQMSECVESCIQSNQMRAVAAEQIESECRDECKEQARSRYLV